MNIETLIKIRQEAALKEVPEGPPNLTPFRGAPEGRLGDLARRVRRRFLESGRTVDLDAPEGQGKARQILWRLIEEEEGNSFGRSSLTPAEKADLLEQIGQDLFGHGVIEPFLRDPGISEVMINGPNQIFIETEGCLKPAVDRRGRQVRFSSTAELLYVVEKILAPINRRVTEAEPIVDGRLNDGSRINVVLRPVALEGPVVTIRKFSQRLNTLENLVEHGAMDENLAGWLRLIIKARYNLVVSGGTGTGKTTMLNALAREIPSSERLVTVEEAAELRLANAENIVRLETRPANIEGNGQITIRDLVRTALRMRPDRIIVGEVRGGEALDMLQAMNTGHDGSLTTAHANSSVDVLARLETMALMAGTELPLTAVRRQIASAMEVVIHLARFPDGTRRVVQVTEVAGMVGEEIITRDLFLWQDGILSSTGADLERGEKLARHQIMSRTAGWLNSSIAAASSEVMP